ncbi:hypothetical protein EHZ13_15100 [Clostridium perfringens]|uniref:hypothetical protein n=1 Tax=Clostridium perfringens TaxID=1502 RepID=UPI000F54526F|nr:hypothetical protein [Clostridium perfringens]MDK3122635.1 hypothetical protein [Clostridium perfringens]RQN11243.1 hypothetical protein EHZ13_15100 [Clostridium perfringens]
MNKSCLECYFKYSDPEGCTWGEECFGKEICNKYTRKCCECSDQANYKYNGKYYCTDCLLEKFDIEEEKTTRYYLGTRYLGDDDIDTVVKNLNKDIRKLEEEEKFNDGKK